MKFNVNWEQLKLLPNHPNILVDIISNYEWIRSKYITPEEMIKYLEEHPLEAEITEYGIHGLMVSVSLGSFYWNVFTLDQFEPILKEEFKMDKIYLSVLDKSQQENVGRFLEHKGLDGRKHNFYRDNDNLVITDKEYKKLYELNLTQPIY